MSDREITRADGDRDTRIAVLQERMARATEQIEQLEKKQEEITESITKGKAIILVLIALGGILSWIISVWRGIFGGAH